MSITRQCALLGLSRSSFYHQGKGERRVNRDLMRLTDEQFLETSWYGSRQMARWLRRQGRRVGRKRVARLMGKMGRVQFTSQEFTQVLNEAGVRISMDGRGRWMDNVMIERLWRSLKYECVYLHAFETGGQARKGIGDWIDYYNQRRPHSSLGGQTPDEAYWDIPTAGTVEAAA